MTCQFQKLPWKVSVHKVLSIKNCVEIWRTRKRILLKCDFWDIKICFLISSRRKRIILKSGISKDAICFLFSSKTNSSFKSVIWKDAIGDIKSVSWSQVEEKESFQSVIWKDAIGDITDRLFLQPVCLKRRKRPVHPSYASCWYRW